MSSITIPTMDAFCWWLCASLALIGAVTLWVWHGWNRKGQASNGAVVPKGNLGWPFIGETLEFIASGCSSRPVAFMEKRRSMYGKVFKSHLLGTPIIVSTDAEVNKAVLQNHGAGFIPAYPKSIRELMGEGSILRLEGSLHKRLHGVIKATLRSPHLKARVTREIERSVKLAMAGWTDRPIVYIQEETKKITFEILVNVLMGIKPGEQMDAMRRDFAQVMKALICVPLKFPGTTMYKSLQAKRRLEKLVRSMIHERVKKMEGITQHTTQHADVMDALLREMTDPEEGQHLSLDFIAGNIVQLMIPGEETVPTAMTLAVKYLSDHPDALHKLLEENMQLKNQKSQSQEGYCWMDYMSMPFTQSVISETLRISNIVNSAWRKAIKDVEIKGYLIPKGWCVMTSFSSIHLDDEAYEDPGSFDPWRWERRGTGTNVSHFTPFGGGQRLCPGMEFSRFEISIFLHHLITTCAWRAEDDSIVYFPTVKLRNKMPIHPKPLLL